MGQKQARIKQEILDDLVSQTNFTHQEIIEWHSHFFKDCPNGTINQKEFERIFMNFFPYGKVEHFSQILFDLFDLNHDHLIDFQEFMVALNITSRGSYEDKLRWAFNLYDDNKDGYITRPEMIAVITAIYRMIGNIIKMPENESTPEKRVAKIFASMDKDNDSKLSIYEFISGVQHDPLICKMFHTRPENVLSAIHPVPKMIHSSSTSTPYHSSSDIHMSGPSNNNLSDYSNSPNKMSRSRESSQELLPDLVRRQETVSSNISNSPFIYHKNSAGHVANRRRITSSSGSLIQEQFH